MSTIHTTLSFLFLFILNFRDLFAQLCHPEQRDALLEVKKQFEIGECSGFDYMNKNGTIVSPHPKTESWRNNTDCCYWDGIMCDPRTGKVIELNLEHSCLHGRFHSNTLQNLASLIILDLSFNDLDGQIGSSIGKLSHLTSLNISDNKFLGQIPSSIGKLYDLTSLVLSDNQFSGQIPYSIGKLSNLTFLDLSDNQFSGRIPYSIGNLSDLTSLSLYNNQFSGQIPYSIGNLSRLTALYFSRNNFVGELPSTFGSLNQLTAIQVDSNNLSGTLPIAILNLTNLSDLSLSYNQFTGTLPPNITSLPNLEYLLAANNAFVGTLHSSLSTIPSVTNNQLDGPLPLPSKLLELSLGSNRFTGPIPRSISKLVNLQVLDLSHWNAQGPVDFSIFSHLKSLIDLDLSYLNNTKIDLTAISSFSKTLDTLDLSGNHVFATNKSSVSDPPLQLITRLILRGCGFTEFPEILRTQQNLSFLDISSNKMKGQVPGWLWTLPKLSDVYLSNNNFTGMERSIKHGLSSNIVNLDLSNNEIKGQVPGWLWELPSLSNLDLSNNNFISFERPTKPGKSYALLYFIGSKNNFTGNIPSLICQLRSLIILDLSVNDFNGSIPHCLENLKGNLSYLNLRHNHLIGGLPQSVFQSLRSIDVGHNQLVGKLPRSLMNFSALEVLNVESNRINDVFPLWLSFLQNLQILVLRSNAFHGPIHQASFRKLQIIDISYNQFSGKLPSNYFVDWSAMASLGTNKDQSAEKYMGKESGYYSIVLMTKGTETEIVRILKVLAALDFSGNKLEGEIPDSISLLKELRSLSLSSNAFTGHIPSSLRNLTSLESLDVSQNKLSGKIPQELGTLSFLSYMNFSNNQLVGLVPGGTQFRTQRCSSYENNPGLFGPALDEACGIIHNPPPQQYETPEVEEEEEEEVFSWIAAAIGFGPGIVFGMTMGYVFVYNKPEWFRSPFGRNKRRSRGTTTR